MERINGLNDMFNARQCEIIALCAGNKDAKLADFLILSRGSEPERSPETPDEIGEKLKMFAMSMGGKVINRG